MGEPRPLTDLAVKRLRPADRPFKVGAGYGMHLLVQPNGSKLWRYQYRFDRKQKLLALGAYPAVSLAQAREKRDAARGRLEAGVDPSAERAAAKAGRLEKADTFEAMATDWFAIKKTSLAASYADRIWGRLRDDVFPAIGSTPGGEVTPRQVLDLLRVMENRGAVELAKRVWGYVNEIFQWAIVEQRAERNPAADIRRGLARSVPKAGRASVAPADAPALLAAMDGLDRGTLGTLALNLALLTFTRTQEFRFARWPDFDLDGKEPTWRVPAERMKMKRPHIVPLAPQTVALMGEVRGLGLPGDLVFPAATRSGVISENTCLFALYRIGYQGRQTVHGFRSLASTTLNESGLFNEDWIERQLAHVEGNKVRAAYNAAEYLPERRAMMLWWADQIDAWRMAGRLL